MPLSHHEDGHLETQVIFLECESDQVAFLRKEPSLPEMPLRGHHLKEFPPPTTSLHLQGLFSLRTVFSQQPSPIVITILQSAFSAFSSY